MEKNDVGGGEISVIKAKEDGEKNLVEGNKLDPKNVPPSLMSAASKANGGIPPDERNTVYEIPEEDAKKLKKRVGDIPLVNSRVTQGVTPQYLLMLLNNGAFLLAAVIPGGALVFAAVLFANIKILPKLSSKSVKVDTINGPSTNEEEDTETSIGNKGIGDKPASLGSKEASGGSAIGSKKIDDKSANLGAKEREAPASMGMASAQNSERLGSRGGRLGDRIVSASHTAEAGNRGEKHSNSGREVHSKSSFRESELKKEENKILGGY
ncbi:MAG: hypothetical protein LBB24_01405 [Rickettsiales bacterium]|jgi:hypothetical protein|nr:hypothetical protein [Rickettsiales bacterium]